MRVAANLDLRENGADNAQLFRGERLLLLLKCWLCCISRCLRRCLRSSAVGCSAL